jgi:hypothetical protein
MADERLVHNDEIVGSLRYPLGYCLYLSGTINERPVERGEPKEGLQSVSVGLPRSTTPGSSPLRPRRGLAEAALLDSPTRTRSPGAFLPRQRLWSAASRPSGPRKSSKEAALLDASTPVRSSVPERPRKPAWLASRSGHPTRTIGIYMEDALAGAGGGGWTNGHKYVSTHVNRRARP